MPEHQWPDGVTVAWAAASTTGDFTNATRVKFDRTPSAGGGVSSYNDLTDKPTTFPPAAHNHTVAQITGLANAPVRFSTATATITATASDRALVARTITSARMEAATAPVGSPLTVQVQHTADGTTWTTIATLTIPTGSAAYSEVIQTGLTQAQAVGNRVRLNVTSVGSTTAATGVVVDVIAT